MPLSKHLTTITPFSKFLAFFLFITLPLLGFFLGNYYGQSLGKSLSCENITQTTTSCTQSSCSEEAKKCSDGSYVFRVGPSCEFSSCPDEKVIPTTSPIDEALLKIATTKEEQISLQVSFLSGIKREDLIIIYQKQPTEDTEYAGGKVTDTKNQTNKWFLAAKINGRWKVTSISNGIPDCKNVAPYYYPKAVVPSCMDEKDNIVAR